MDQGTNGVDAHKRALERIEKMTAEELRALVEKLAADNDGEISRTAIRLNVTFRLGEESSLHATSLMDPQWFELLNAEQRNIFFDAWIEQLQEFRAEESDG